jgi:hypothetical protein
VEYESKGELSIVGPLDAAMGWAKVLAPQLAVTVPLQPAARRARRFRRSARSRSRPAA